MMLATLFLCIGPGLLSWHGRCISAVPPKPLPACLTVVPSVHNGAHGEVCTYIAPPCEVTLQFEKGKEVTHQFTVLHDNGACVRPNPFILGGDYGELLKIEHEDLAWQGEQVERVMEAK